MEKVVVVVADMEKEPSLSQCTSCDMEEVVVVADVDKECLPPQTTSTNINMEEKTTSTIEEAKKIREHQGSHEAEVSCGGEADLHRHLTGCTKNSGHLKFIPVEDFKKKHLPPDYRDNATVNWIRAEADLTCRLSVRYTCEHRPQFCPGSQNPYPFYQDRGGNWLRTGTGFVSYVNKYTEKDGIQCKCKDCSTPGKHTPKKAWGKVVIFTACHVVFDSDEARHTTCEFFYNTSTFHVSQCPTLTGLKVECSDIEGDMCMMTCVTHDMDLVDKLVKMFDRRLELFEKVRSKYWLDQCRDVLDRGISYVTDPTPGHVIVISHPHGCSKHISIGEWTHRQTREYSVDFDLDAESVRSSYKYNAATCPGSSGAPVIRLLEKGKVGWWWLLYSHPHSGGDAGNDNYSGSMEEFVSFPPSSSDQCSKRIIVSTLLSIAVCSSLAMILAMAITGEWDVENLWSLFGTVMICVFCFCFIPWFRQYRGLLSFFVISGFLYLLFFLITFVKSLVQDYHIRVKIMYGVFSIIIIPILVFNFKLLRAAFPLTAYNIQRRLRRRTMETDCNKVSDTTTAAATTSIAAATRSPSLELAITSAASATRLSSSSTTTLSSATTALSLPSVTPRSLSLAAATSTAASAATTTPPLTSTKTTPLATTAATTSSAILSSPPSSPSTKSLSEVTTTLSSLTITTTTTATTTSVTTPSSSPSSSSSSPSSSSSLTAKTTQSSSTSTTTTIDMNYGTIMNTEYTRNCSPNDGLCPVLVRY